MKTFIFLFLALVPNLRLLAGTLTANVERTQFESGEEVMLSVEVEGSIDGDPDLGGSSDFEVGGRSESTQVQIINGSMSKRKTYTYSLLPRKNGSLTIPAVSAKVDGKIEKTLPIAISVGGGGAKNGARSGGAGTADSQASDSDLYHLERSLSPGPYYKHMPIVETIHIYRRLEWQEASKLPVTSPEWQIYEQKDEEKKIETRAGVNYSVISLKRVLVPLKSGSLRLPGFTVMIQFLDPRRRQRANPFDIFSGASLSKRQLNIDEKNLSIADLPEPDLPVGELTPTVSLSSSSVKVGDSVTMEFKVSGKAWFSGLPLNPPDLQGAFKVYKDQPQTSEEATSAGLSGSKSIKLSLVPSEPGKLEFSPWQFKFLDPKSGKVVEKSIPIPALEVTGTKEEVVISGATSSRPEVPKDASRDHDASFYGKEASGFPWTGARKEFVRALLGVSALMFLISGVVAGRRKWLSGQNPDYGAVMKSWKALASALNSKSSLSTQVQAFRKYGAVRIQAEVPSVTVRDVRWVLEKDGWAQNALEEVEDLFRIFDSQKYNDQVVATHQEMQKSALEIKRRKPCFL